MKRKAILALCFWILMWQLISMWVSSPILLASPISVGQRLSELAGTGDFWLTVLRSLLSIFCGFFLAVLVGSVLASLSYYFHFIYELFSPLLSVIKAIPVASFIILVLVWVKSTYITAVISFLMVLPIIYFGVYSGFSLLDEGLLEVAKVYRLGLRKKWRYIYGPALLPSAFVGIQTGIGFAFKSGVSAEVIGLTRHTIGYAIYNAKINLETADLLGWTVVIVLLSWILEKILLFLLQKLKKRLVGT